MVAPPRPRIVILIRLPNPFCCSTFVTGNPGVVIPNPRGGGLNTPFKPSPLSMSTASVMMPMTMLPSHSRLVGESPEGGKLPVPQPMLIRPVEPFDSHLIVEASRFWNWQFLTISFQISKLVAAPVFAKNALSFLQPM